MKRNFKLVILLVVCCFLFVGCGKKQETLDNNIDLDAPNDVKIETYKNYDGSSMIVKLTNNGSNDLSKIAVSVSYPDSSDDDNYVVINNFKANSTTYTLLDLPYDENFEYYVPDNINLTVATDGELLQDIEDLSKYADKVKATCSADDDVINYSITNNSGKILGSVDSVIVYFKNNVPVAGDYIMSFGVEESFEGNRDVLYTGDIENPKYIDYDDVQIYVTGIVDDYDEEDFEDEIIEDDVIEDETVDYDDDMSWE